MTLATAGVLKVFFCYYQSSYHTISIRRRFVLAAGRIVAAGLTDFLTGLNFFIHEPTRLVCYESVADIPNVLEGLGCLGVCTDR
jgi:hypothetical protein